MTQALIELSDLSFSWPGHAPLLDIPAFALEPGETLFLKGPSGSGKTTLLGLLGGVQKPDRGSIRLLGQELTQLSAGARDRFRVDSTRKRSRAPAESCVSSWPSRRMLPRSGFCTPPSNPSSVVLPLPLGPFKNRVSPGSRANAGMSSNGA